MHPKLLWRTYVTKPVSYTFGILLEFEANLIKIYNGSQLVNTLYFVLLVSKCNSLTIVYA